MKTTVMTMKIHITKVVAVVVAAENTLAAEDQEMTVIGIMILSIIQEDQTRASVALEI